MTKLKLKKKVLHRGIILLIIILVGSFFGIKFYKEYKYKQTYEYKLIEHGYTLEESQSLVKYFKKDEQLESLLKKDKNSYILELIKEKYYIHKNLDRYLAYADKNKKIHNYVTVIRMVSLDFNIGNSTTSSYDYGGDASE